MSDLADRLTPPRETRTPQWHYEQADRLVAELDDMQPHELVLPHGKSKMVLADLHARLAGCARPEPACLHPDAHAAVICHYCGSSIGKWPGSSEWVHHSTGRAHCYRDPQHTETATPNERI